MIFTDRIRKNKKYASVIILLTAAILCTSCTNIVNGIGEAVKPESIKSKVDGEQSGELPDFDPKKREDTQHREKKEIDYSVDRFNVEGTNAFYILPGIENIPDAMAVFEVLDYNSLGEFVYYYVTPCYSSPEEFMEFVQNNRTGTVKDTSGVEVPKGRREDYEYDAGVLMSYNPDTGAYRIMYANAFKIDKEKEFDPAKEGRPYLYKSKEGEDKTGRIYTSERLLGCKVSGREEYFLMDQGSLSGVLYDSRGNANWTMTYRTSVRNEMEIRRRDFAHDKDHGNRKIMNAAITGVAMTRSHESYLGATFFMGDYEKEDDLDEDDLQISKTMLIYRLDLNRAEGGVPFVSVNLNSDVQKEKWLSLDRKFFTSEDELKEAEGYSLVKLKNGMYGDGYKDAFSAFTAADSDDRSMAFQVQIPNFYDLNGSWYDDKFTEDLVFGIYDNCGRNVPYTSIWSGRKLQGFFEQFTKKASKVSKDDLPSKVEDLNYQLSRMEKRISQMILSDALSRRMKSENMTGASVEELEAYFENKGFLPKPGAYEEKSNLNESPEGFYGDIDNVRDTIKNQFTGGAEVKQYDHRIPEVSIISDHIISVVSQNGIYSNYVAPVDYFPEGENDWEDGIFVKGLRMAPLSYTDPMERTVYVFDTAEADRQINEIGEAAGLSESQMKAVEELKLLLRTSASDWGNTKLAWLINEVIKNPGGLIETVSGDAGRARDEGRISQEEYEKLLELVNSIRNDEEKNAVHETFERARQDAKNRHDEGGLSDEEYERVLDTLNRAEQEKLGLDDDDWQTFQSLNDISLIIADAKRAIASGGDGGKMDTVDRIESLSGEIPEDIREGMLYLCAGFKTLLQKAEACPLSYEVIFPDGAGTIATSKGRTETVGGSLDTTTDGIVVAAESEGKQYSGNTFLLGFESANTMDFFNEFVCGKPLDLATMDYNDGKAITTVVAICTDKGVRFFRKENKTEERELSNKKLKKMFGEENANLICGVDKIDRFIHNEYVDYNDKATLVNTYSPLNFDARGNEAYEAIKGDKNTSLPSEVSEKDFTGFLTYKMLLTSSGYTRDVENRLTEAIDESLKEIGARENSTDGEEANPDKDNNERYTGHLSSADNICMIDKNKALICSVGNGTKILDLDHGTVADDLEGAYFRAFQVGSKKTYKLLGFEDKENAYLDVDLPLAKVITVEYDNAQIDRTEIEAFKKMLLQYAKDYLYREYRTELNESGEIVIKEKTDQEKQESQDAGRIFDPASKDFEEPLLELEKKYGIDKTTDEIREYTLMLRDRVAGVAPAITRLYELAGATKLAADSAKRNTGYWRNLESRMTMAVELSALKDILIEIRMSDDVLPSLDAVQAQKYRSYKKVLDLAKEHTSISAGDIFGKKGLSGNDADSDEERLRQQYRNDVIKDIISDFGQDYVSKAAGSDEVPSDEEIEKQFNDQLNNLLNRVNPDNFVLDDEKTVDEFADVINHGRERLTGKRFEEFSEGLKDDLASINSVWLLEELVIRKKVQNKGAYSEYQDWLNEYDEKVKEAELKGLNLSLPGTDKEKGNDQEKKKGLSGDERIRYLRTSPAYKAIIGDIKQDPEVKDFLAKRKETWDDYCTYVVKKAGLGTDEEQ